MASRLAGAPSSFEEIVKFSQFKAAHDDSSHPDHALARLLAGDDPVRLPLMAFDTMTQRLISGLNATHLERPAHPPEIAAAHERLFGKPATPKWTESLRLSPHATVRDLYRSAVETESFRAACGRISASTAW